jgi:tetratricopeptide (TPR) repeat protein
MSWTTDEIESLYNLLFSADENNVLLAIELIKAKGEIEPFTAALAFIDAFENGLEAGEAAQELLKAFLSTEELAPWGNSLRMVHSVWYAGQAEFMRNLEAYKEKMHIFDEFIKRAPRYAYIYREIGRQIASDFKKKKLGLEYLRKAVELNPNSYDANFDYAYYLPEQKKYADEMIKHYQRCIDIGARGFEPYHNMGRVYAFQKKMPKKGVEVFKEGLAKFPGSVDTMVEMAYTLDDMGEFEEARTILEDALALDDSYHLAHNNYAFILLNSYKEFEKARHHVDKALELAPKEGLYWHTLAEIEWYGYQDKKKALEALYKAQSDKKYKGAKQMIKELESNEL